MNGLFISVILFWVGLGSLYSASTFQISNYQGSGGNAWGYPIVDGLGIPLKNTEYQVALGTLPSTFSPENLSVSTGGRQIVQRFSQVGETIIGTDGLDGLFSYEARDLDPMNLLDDQHLYVLAWQGEALALASSIILYDPQITFPIERIPGLTADLIFLGGAGEVVFGETDVDVDATGMSVGSFFGQIYRMPGVSPIAVTIPEPSVLLMVVLFFPTFFRRTRNRHLESICRTVHF